MPVGGGGLISGVAFAIKSLRPEVKVYGVQAEGAPSMYRSLHEHKYQTLKAVSTFADGIQVKTPGELTYQICEQYVDDIVTVSEDETAAAILSLMENQKLVAEGAGAVPVAAVLFHKLPVEGKKVACVVSGGNIDVNILNRVITPWSGHERPQGEHDHCAGGQARPAQEGGRDRVPLRQQCGVGAARWLRSQHAHFQLLPQAHP